MAVWWCYSVITQTHGNVLNSMMLICKQVAIIEWLDLLYCWTFSRLVSARVDDRESECKTESCGGGTWQTAVKYNPNYFMERSSAAGRPTDQVILDRNKLVLMNEWMNGHRGRLNIMTITRLCAAYTFLPSPRLPPPPPLLSPLLWSFSLLPLPACMAVARDKRSKSANRPIHQRIRLARVGRSKNIDGLIFDRRGDCEPDRRLSASHSS